MAGAFKIFRVIVGELDTNCYLVANPAGQCLIIDPGAEAEKIISAIWDNALIPAAIILTHGHYDHIGAVEQIAKRFGLPVYAHPAEMEVLSDPHLNYSAYAGRPVSLSAEPIEEGNLPIAGFEGVEVLHLPGHTPGSIGLVGDIFLISGDTVFGGGGVGRTDLPGGDPNALAESIEKILALDDSLVLYPGHGGRSILGREKNLWRQSAKMLREGLI